MGSVGKQRNTGATTVTTASGKITLPEPLAYGSYDVNVPQSILDFEEKRKSAKIEFSLLVNDDGTVIESNKGGKYGVKASTSARLNADILSHNHPRSDDGILGGTFSPGDINNFMKYNQHTYRADAKEGVYSMTKGERLGNDVQLRADMYKAYRDFDAGVHKESGVQISKYTTEYTSQARQIESDFRAGRISREEAINRNNEAYGSYVVKANAEVNRALVQLHNWLIEHQKQYDYKYALFQRG